MSRADQDGSELTEEPDEEHLDEAGSKVSESEPVSPHDVPALEAQFQRAFGEFAALMIRFEQAQLRTGERARLKELRAVAERGLSRLLDRRKEKGRQKLIDLVEDFLRVGPAALLLTGSQRGGDFLNNQLRGRWAEEVGLSLKVEGLVIRRLGPSGAAMPGEEDHRTVVGTFTQIQLLEGKRPDLVGFSEAAWAELEAEDLRRIATWPERVLEPDDEALLRRAACAMEVKNSTWHYEARHKTGRGPLAVTAKVEELSHLDRWSRQYGVPIVFIQVLFDRMYCMSFRRMQEGIERGHLYSAGDVLRDERGAGGKVYYRIFVTDDRHYCADVTYPNESVAHVRTLPDGSVIPYIEFRPARAVGTRSDIVWVEIRF